MKRKLNPRKKTLEKLNNISLTQQKKIRELLELADLAHQTKQTCFYVEFVKLVNESNNLSMSTQRVCVDMAKLKIGRVAAEAFFIERKSISDFNAYLRMIKGELFAYFKPKNWRLLRVRNEENQEWWELKKWVNSTEYALTHVSNGIAEQTNKIVFGVQLFGKGGAALSSAQIKHFETPRHLFNFLEQ